jgi:GNAT superfamily N-acetyltransferase
VTHTRLAIEADAEAIARIQVAGWRSAYAHILPIDFLAGLDADGRAKQWRTRIGPSMRADSPTFVAVDETNAVVGFAHTGPCRDDDLPEGERGEVYTMYVDPPAWRRGIGSVLTAAIDEFWAPTGVDELTLWVFEDNAGSRAFYEAVGWRPDGARKVDDFGGASPTEVRYRRPVRR